MSHRDDTSAGTSRRTVLRKGAIGGSVGLLGFSSVSRTDAQNGPTTITECRDIEDPGEYIFGDDIEADGGCLHVNAGEVTIDGNGYRLEGDGSGRGLWLAGGSHTVRNLTIEGFETGLHLTSDDTTLTSLTIQGNSETGIACWDARNVLFEDLTIRENDGDGVFIDDDNDSLTIRDCDVVENGRFPINGGSSAPFVLEDSRIVDNGDALIFTPMSSENERLDVEMDTRIEGTEISGSDGAGIRTDLGDAPALEEPTPITNCVIRDNDGPGIDHRYGWLDVRECTLAENQTGFYAHLGESRKTKLRTNNIEDNDEYGVLHTDVDENPTIDGRCNWWGDESGPVHEDNPNDDPQGDRVSDGVEFTPWSVERIEDGEGSCEGGLDEDEGTDDPPEGGTGYISRKSYRRITRWGPYEDLDCWDGTFYVTDPSDVDRDGHGGPGEITVPSSSDDDADNHPLTGHVIRAESDAVPVTLPTWGGDRGDCESLLFVDPDQDLHTDVEYRIVTDDPDSAHEEVDTNGFAQTIDEIVRVDFEPTRSGGSNDT